MQILVSIDPVGLHQTLPTAIPRSRVIVFFGGIVCLSVCMFLSVCNTITFESFDLKVHVWSADIRSGDSVKLAYEGHRQGQGHSKH